ncbi:sugar-binding protein [Cocleimonas flava]|nr:sugar-binding protein [Cocleimonas flava]
MKKFQQVTILQVLASSLMALLLSSGISNDAQASPFNQNSPLGMNTNEALEVDASLPFADIFRLALPFNEARPWFTKGNVSFDKDGWPKNLNGGQAGTRFLSHIPIEALPKGEYTVLYQGEGKINYGASAKVVKRSPGKDIIKLVPMKQPNEMYPTATATLFIKESNPKNYIRNIRIMMPGGICRNDPFKRVTAARQCANNSYQSFADNHNQVMFNPDFLNFMKDFKVVRFMNMSGVTRNNIRSWNDRPTLQKATWGGKEGVRGVPIEVMIQLANILDVDPWFNIPHNADNVFINRFAQTVKQQLKPNLRVYLEYTNEAWNNIFVPQAEHMKQTGYKLKLDKDRNIAGSKYYSMQSVNIFKMWERVFGGTDRLVRVMGGMTTNTKLTETLLGFQNAYKHVDAIAVAPYFHFSQDKMAGIKSVNDVFTTLNARDNRYSIRNTLDFVKKQMQVTKGFGVDLIAYEGGQHLVHHKTHSMTQGATPHLYKANKDKRMAAAYYQLLAGWKKLGGKLFIPFSAPRPSTWHGSWGIKEHIAETPAQAPKYRSLLGFSHGNPCWWESCRGGKIVRHQKPTIIAKHLVSGKQDESSAKYVAIQKQPPGQRTLHQAKAEFIGTVIQGTIENPRDLTARWRANWDDNNLYVWVGIIDEVHVSDSKESWADDSIEIYIDADASRGETYDQFNDFHLSFSLGKSEITAGSTTPLDRLKDIKYTTRQLPTGYQLEAAIPWSTLNIQPSAEHAIGFDIQINDDDNGDARDAKISWNATIDQAWKNPRVFGQLILQDKNQRFAKTDDDSPMDKKAFQYPQ